MSQNDSAMITRFWLLDCLIGRSAMSAFDPKRTLVSPKSRNGTVGSDHSGLMLANLITFAHFSTSAVMKI
jgi:hypothetical protein